MLLRLVLPKETSMTAQHILVPIDFSAYADQALEYAIELAKTLQARLTLLHVIHLTPWTMGDMVTTFPGIFLEDVETEAQQLMQASRGRLHDAGLQGETVIVHGVPFQAIINIASEQDVDLIIMGTHGRTGLTHLLMGSVAEKVVRLAPCPVLVTRGTTEATET
jgi:nucleotide-binding universal stress UspA family protein